MNERKTKPRTALWALLLAVACAVLVAGGLLCRRTGGTKAVVEEKNTMLIIKTNKGNITVELFDKQTPITVSNFLSYVDSGHYRGTVFHRVIPGFMIQGGGMTRDLGQKRTQAPIKNEAQAGLKNARGTLAMARTSQINSATSQFFINLVNNVPLDHTSNASDGFGYCVFGRVVQGMDVVDAIAAVKTGTRGPFENVPLEPVELLDVVRAPAAP
jgi:cyclophilin family peptidyl-prolyl cis-trans isomerase